MNTITRGKKTHLFSTERSSALRVMTYAGAIMAFLIGSGFATGQEVMQYFAAYGFWRRVQHRTSRAGPHQFCFYPVSDGWPTRAIQQAVTNFEYYAGKYIGKFFDYFSILFVFLSFTVMVAGAGAVFDEHYIYQPGLAVLD